MKKGLIAMKQNKEDIIILMAVIGIIISIIGFTYLIREFRPPSGSGSDSPDTAPETYYEISQGQDTEGPEKSETALTPAKVRLLIDAIMAAGLLGGLSLILRGKVNYVFIIVAVGIITVLIDLYLRRLFG